MALFSGRLDAGEQLARHILKQNTGIKNAVVLGIPRGGIETGFPIAASLSCPLEPVTVRKLPLPGDDQMGFGVVTLDKEVIINEELVRRGYVAREDIDAIVSAVFEEVLRRDKAYRGGQPFPDMAGRSAVIVDDGLATGYTMAGAVRFARKRKASNITVAVPVAHAEAVEMLKAEADTVISLHTTASSPFAVASFYEDFHDLSDREVIGTLRNARRLNDEVIEKIR